MYAYGDFSDISHTTIELVLIYTFRKQVFIEISFLNIILASTKSDNPLYIYVVFYIKIYPNRPPCSKLWDNANKLIPVSK
ncbi:hypothetical protein BpHYR1_045841, partial [Brachionus plicatilis]